MRETTPSEKLRQAISDNGITKFEFSDKRKVVEWLRQWGQSDIVEGDIPDFKGSINFENEEFIALIRDLESKTTAEKINILRTTIVCKTQQQTAMLKSNIEATRPVKLDEVKDVLESAILSPILAPSILSEKFFSALQKRGYAIRLDRETIKITHPTSTPQEIADLEVLVNGYIGAKKISVDRFREALVYNSPDFSSFVTARTDAQGKPLGNEPVKVSNYIEVLNKKYGLVQTDPILRAAEISEKVKNENDKALLLAYNPLDFSRLENSTVKDYSEKTKTVDYSMASSIEAAKKTGRIVTPVATVDVSSEAAQKHLKDFDGKKFAQDFVKAPVGTTMGLAGDIIKASGSAAPVVLIGFLYLAFKGLTGEFWTKNHKFAGWKILLTGLFAHGVAKAFGRTDVLANEIGGGWTMGTGVRKMFDSVSDTPVSDPIEVKNLSSSQKYLREKIEGDTVLKTKVNGFAEAQKKAGGDEVAEFPQYLDYIEKNIGNFPLEKIFSKDQKKSIYSEYGDLDISIASNMDPIIFKKVLRAYIQGSGYETLTGTGEMQGEQEKNRAIQELGLKDDDIKNKTLADIIPLIHKKRLGWAVDSAPENAPAATHSAVIELAPWVKVAVGTVVGMKSVAPIFTADGKLARLSDGKTQLEIGARPRIVSSEIKELDTQKCVQVEYAGQKVYIPISTIKKL